LLLLQMWPQIAAWTPLIEKWQFKQFLGNGPNSIVSKKSLEVGEGSPAPKFVEDTAPK
jgi:hypothetical protein